MPGWFDPPLCVFGELPDWLGRTEREPCDDFARAALVGSVLRRTAGKIFGKAARAEHFLEAVERVFGELITEDIAPDTFRAALDRLPDRDAFEEERDKELAAAYALYVTELERGKARDGRDALADSARAIVRDPRALASGLGGRREIRFFGLADLRGGWRPLLRALAASPALDRVTIYTADEIALESGLLGQTTRLSDPVPLPSFTLIPAPEIDGELEAVALRVRRLLDAGTPANRIAIVSRDARPHLDIALQALARCGVPATARRRHSILEIPVVRAVVALFAAAAENWPRHRLVELAGQPYFGSQLDARILNYVGYRRRVERLANWASALGALESEARAKEDAAGREPDEHPRWMPGSRWVADAKARFAGFAERIAALDGAKPLAEWLEWLAAFVREDPWRVLEHVYQVPHERFDIARLDIAGWSGLERVVRAWLAATQRWDPGTAPLDAAAFHERLTAMLDADAALWTQTDRGVRVLEGLAAAYRSFDHVFLVGMEAGRFPKPVPSSPIFTEPERLALKAAGLPLDLRADWDAREGALFRAMVAGAEQSITLSYVAQDEFGGDRLESVFVEVLAEQSRRERVSEHDLEEELRRMPLHHVPEVARHAQHAATIEVARALGTESPWNGQIADPALVAWLGREFGDTRMWSPTQLEAYAKCPWAYFSGRILRIEKLEDPDEDIDPIERGNVLHDTLRRFYERAKAKVGKPVLLMPGDESWARPLIPEALEEALAEAKERVWLGHPSLYEAKRRELLRVVRRYLDWEIDDNRKLESKRAHNYHVLRTGVDAHELSFDDVVLERDGIRFRFRGRIDRVEVGVDTRVMSTGYVAAVDYKSSIYGVPGEGRPEAWTDGIVLQLPLYAHALRQMRADAEISRVEYRIFRGDPDKVPLQLVRVDDGAIASDVEGEALLESALDAVVDHVRAVRGGKFPVAPAPSCGCPPFCHALDICRIAGGPRLKRTW